MQRIWILLQDNHNNQPNPEPNHNDYNNFLNKSSYKGSPVFSLSAIAPETYFLAIHLKFRAAECLLVNVYHRKNAAVRGN